MPVSFIGVLSLHQKGYQAIMEKLWLKPRKLFQKRARFRNRFFGTAAGEPMALTVPGKTGLEIDQNSGFPSIFII
jgi:hypothetical protein